MSEEISLDSSVCNYDIIINHFIVSHPVNTRQ
jgi:hypothetical protein